MFGGIKKVKINFKKIFKVVAASCGVILLCFGIKTYMNYVNVKALKLSTSSETIYTKEDALLGDDGFYSLNLEEDLQEYLENEGVDVVTYNVSDANFYVELSLSKIEETGERILTIDKVVDVAHHIKTSMYLTNVKSMAYVTDSKMDVTMLKIVSQYDNKYFVIKGDNYYFLGSEVGDIYYENGYFYYRSYNENYSVLETANSCSEDIKKGIYEFNPKDTYYATGKIILQNDNYHKMTSKKYTVKDKCNEIKNR